MIQQYTNLRRRSYKYLLNYEVAWQNLANVLAQKQSHRTIQQFPLATSTQQTSHKPKTELAFTKLYTPIDNLRLFESEHKLYVPNKIRPQSSKPKNLFRRTTDNAEDFQSIPAPVDNGSPFNPKLMKRPMSSFTKQKFLQKEKTTTGQLPPKKSISQRLYTKPFVPPSHMTAYSYVILEPPHTLHVSWNSQTALEVASLTKIMTCVVVLRLIDETGSSLDQTVEVGSFETNLSGTTAELQKGFRYSIRQLLYGLMLPSGNDASIALAVWGGRILHRRNKRISIDQLDTETTFDRISKRDSVALFVAEMNRVAQQMGLKRTHYANPHGLPNSNNKSTAYDIALLCRQAMERAQFRRIVSTKQYRTCAESCEGDKEILTWSNTHRLLSKKEYLGIKTGFTSTAGACLASYLSLGGRDFIIVVLKCKKVNSRFKQTQILKRWLMKKEDIKKQEHPEEECVDDLQ